LIVYYSELIDKKEETKTEVSDVHW